MNNQPVYFLITGSRGMGLRGKAFARQVTVYAMQCGVNIIVGDAEGVDETVITQANAWHYEKIQVVGGYGRVKHYCLDGENVPFKGKYPERDKWMAFRCTHCLGIWDGSSHGTQITFAAAGRGKRPTRVVIFEGNKVEWWRWSLGLGKLVRDAKVQAIQR